MILELLEKNPFQYTKFLNNIMAPLIYESIKQIYNTALEYEKKYIEHAKKEASVKNPGVLMLFQKLLKGVPTINNSQIEEETNRIINASKCADWFENLVKAVIKSNIILLTYNASEKKCKLVKEKFHEKIDLKDFVHKCLIEVSRAFYNYPELMWHVYKPVQIKENQREAIRIIRDCIEEGIRKMLPVKLILEEYLCKDYINDSTVSDKEYLSMEQVVKKDTNTNTKIINSDSNDNSENVSSNIKSKDIEVKNNDVNLLMDSDDDIDSAAKQVDEVNNDNGFDDIILDKNSAVVTVIKEEENKTNNNSNNINNNNDKNNNDIVIDNKLSINNNAQSNPSNSLPSAPLNTQFNEQPNKPESGNINKLNISKLQARKNPMGYTPAPPNNTTMQPVMPMPKPNNL